MSDYEDYDSWPLDMDDLDGVDWASYMHGPVYQSDDHENYEEEVSACEEEAAGENAAEAERTRFVEELAERCAELQRTISALNQELDDVKDVLLGQMYHSEEVETADFRVRKRETARYLFSEEVQRLARELRELRQAEIASGRADYDLVYDWVQVTLSPSARAAKYPRAGAPWEEDDLAQLQDMKQHGVPVSEIARRLQRPPSSVRWKIRQLESEQPGWPCVLPSGTDFADDDDIPF